MMNLRKLLRRFFHSRKQRYCQLWYQQGRFDERTEVLKQQSLPGIADVPLAQQPVTSVVPYVPGVKLDAYRAKRGLKTIKLEPFPWLEDDSWLNSGLLPIPSAVSPVYEPPEVETTPRLSALHELLGCYAETEVKLKAVRERDEGRGKAS
jgi:hypothetical protein